MKVKVSRTQPCLALCDPMDCGLTRLLCSWYSLGKNSGVVSHSLPQGIFLTQGLNSSFPHCGQILYHLSHSVQFSSVAQSCPTLCDPMNRSMPGLPVHQHLLEFTQTHVHRVRDAISSSVVPFSSCPQSLPASESFPMSQLFT